MTHRAELLICFACPIPVLGMSPRYVHHIAFRTHDEREQLQWRDRLVDLVTMLLQQSTHYSSDLFAETR